MTFFSLRGFAFLAILTLAGAAHTAQAQTQKSVPYVWNNVEIVGGGFVDGIVFSPKQPDLIYARTDIGGAYRWKPSTHRWTPLTDWVGETEANLLGTESIGVDPSDANRVYLAQGTYTQAWASNGAMFRSADQGRTWQRTDVPFKMGGNEDGRSMGERLSVDPRQGSVLFFGSRRDGLWRSPDYGATWNRVANFPVPADTQGIGVVFTVFDGSTGKGNAPTPILYTAAANSDTPLYRSADAGATWAAVPGQPEKLIPHHGVLTPAGVLYITYGDRPGPNGMTDGAVWKCDTRTGAWTNITPLKPGSAGNSTFGYAGLTVDAQHPETVMVSTMDWWSHHDEIFRSTDGGAHWAGLKARAVEDVGNVAYMKPGDTAPALGHWIGALQIDPFHSVHVLFGTGATIWGSDDVPAADANAPTHWTIRAQGLEETAVLDLVSPPAGAHLISALGDIGGFRHDDLTLSPAPGGFQNPAFTTTTSLDYAELLPDIVVRVGTSRNAGSAHGAISYDGGASWTPFATEPPGSAGAGHVAVSADGITILWTPNRSVLSYSRDAGRTWTACAGLPAGLRAQSNRVNPQVFYAMDTKAGTLYLSTDGGARFSASITPLPAGANKLCVVPGRAADLWLTSHNGLFHSKDLGLHWAKISAVQSSEAMGHGKAAPGKSYPSLFMDGAIGARHGVFRSDNRGQTWVRINDDAHQYGWLGQTVIGDPRIYGRVYIATNGRGIIMGSMAPASPDK